MTYQQMQNLKKGDRFQVFQDGQWKSGTFHGAISGADAAMWFAFDEWQREDRGLIITKVFTGLQFREDYWNAREGNRFRFPTDEELNEEFYTRMEVPL